MFGDVEIFKDSLRKVEICWMKLGKVYIGNIIFSFSALLCQKLLKVPYPELGNPNVPKKCNCFFHI